ncbi:MAG: hypothetical protein CMI09_05615 [Oceanospirillaceae bacterium]|nr:hypothetical protein [Oceanospirillaceae bacterium]
MTDKAAADAMASDIEAKPEQTLPFWKRPGVSVKVVISAVFITAVLWFLDESAVEMEGGKSAAERVALPVSVVDVTPASMALDVAATGITEARWLTPILSTISGHVDAVPAELKPGMLIPADAELVRFRQTEFRSALAETSAAVADAELQLASVQNEQRVAQRLNKGQKSAFGKFEPHVKAAAARLEAARASEQLARQQLQDTRLTSPFAALVLAQNVARGQWRNAGDELYRLAASEAIDIRIELPQNQWNRLGDISALTQLVVEADGQRQWPAQVRYVSPVIDPVTRQRSLVVEVLNPYQMQSPLLPDEQVRVRISGPVQPHLVQAPASALTEDGKVWTVEQDALRREPVEVLEQGAEHVLLRFVHQPEQSRQLVRFPISTLLQGQKVKVREQVESSMGEKSLPEQAAGEQQEAQG